MKLISIIIFSIGFILQPASSEDFQPIVHHDISVDSEAKDDPGGNMENTGSQLDEAELSDSRNAVEIVSPTTNMSTAAKGVENKEDELKFIPFAPTENSAFLNMGMAVTEGKAEQKEDMSGMPIPQDNRAIPWPNTNAEQEQLMFSQQIAIGGYGQPGGGAQWPSAGPPYLQPQAPHTGHIGEDWNLCGHMPPPYPKKVNCGGHRAHSCDYCVCNWKQHIIGGEEVCNADCGYDRQKRRCAPAGSFPTPQINCGWGKWVIGSCRNCLVSPHPDFNEQIKRCYGDCDWYNGGHGAQCEHLSWFENKPHIVRCGAHRANGCENCISAISSLIKDFDSDRDDFRHWCNGQCMWVEHMKKCLPRPGPVVPFG